MLGPVDEENPRLPRWSAEPDAADFYAAAVYGSIVATALTGAFRQEGADAAGSAVALLSTMVVFWVAHVWSTLVGERIHQGLQFTFHHSIDVARSEWPLIESAFAPSAVFVLGWLGAIGDHTAATIALVVCVLQLLAWGFVLGRRAYASWWSAVVSGLLNGALGAVDRPARDRGPALAVPAGRQSSRSLRETRARRDCGGPPARIRCSPHRARSASKAMSPPEVGRGRPRGPERPVSGGGG